VLKRHWELAWMKTQLQQYEDGDSSLLLEMEGPSLPKPLLR
jgi:hypothetical protein